MTLALPSRRLAPAWVRNDLWRRARAVPSLDLQFADRKSLVDAISGQNLVTFTRASSGTYVGSDGLLKTAATNEPRFDHNPTTGESLGLLVEEQRQNLLLRSEEFDDASWTKSAASITANNITAPNGTNSADKLVESATTAVHFVEQIPSLANAATFVCSIYAKAAERSSLYIWLADTGWATSNAGAIFNLATGTVTSSAGTVSATIVPVVDGWYRCIMGDLTSASGTRRFRIATVFGGTATYAGDGTSGIYIWGAQLEQGAFPTSYIPTTSSAATRNADVASITGSNFSSWYRQDEGTVYVDRIQQPIDSVTGRRFLNISDGSNSNALQLYQSTTGSTVAVSYVSGVSDFAPNTTGVPSQGATVRSTIGFSSTGKSLVRDGGSTATSAIAPPTTGMTTMIVGAQNSTNVSCTSIRRLTYWPQRLPNATLQAITL